MALYEYYCPDCRTKFDALRPMNKADDAITCQSCNSQRPQRVLSLFATHTGSAEVKANSGPSMTDWSAGCCGGSCGCRH